MNNIKYFTIASIASALMLAGCSKSNQWQLKGSVAGASNAHIAIEAAENGTWLPVDTLSTDSKGNFTYKHAATGYPDIYRLAMNGNYIYFPIDSTETITISTTADNFNTEAKIAGSKSAEQLQEVDRRIKQSIDSLGMTGALSDSLLKRDLTNMVLANPAGIVSYYIVCKQIGNQFLFNPTKNVDNRIFGAVANSFNEQRPDDPRTRFLKSVYLSNRPIPADQTDQVDIKEVEYFDISLLDNNGTEHKLSDAVSNNNVVLLNFTLYGAELSPALNVALADAYSKYHAKGFEIYQIALDEDEFFWKQSAKNLPWITVYNPPVASGASRILTNYNVQTVPVSFLLVNGKLIERIEDYENLSAIIGRNI